MTSKIEELTSREKHAALGLRTPHAAVERGWDQKFPGLRLAEFEGVLLGSLRRWSIPLLRVGMGVIFLWFGALKLLGHSPVASLVRQSYPFLPFEPFFVLLGGWEVLIGCGLIGKRALRCTLGSLLLHLTGTLITLWQAPALFFLNSNPFLLTMEGEFLAKNLVLITAGLVIGGYEINSCSADKKL